MTQAELAARCDVTRQTIIAIEQGRFTPSLETAFEIARTFNVRLNEVFEYPDERANRWLHPVLRIPAAIPLTVSNSARSKTSSLSPARRRASRATCRKWSGSR